MRRELGGCSWAKAHFIRAIFQKEHELSLKLATIYFFNQPFRSDRNFTATLNLNLKFSYAHVDMEKS